MDQCFFGNMTHEASDYGPAVAGSVWLNHSVPTDVMEIGPDATYLAETIDARCLVEDCLARGLENGGLTVYIY